MKHFPPTREYLLDVVRERGAKAVYGPGWPETDAATIEALSGLSDVEYMRQCGCDHCDEDGNCLGHEKGGAR